MNIQNVLAEFCEYSKHIKGFSPATIRRYRQTTKVFITLSGKHALHEITKDDVFNFFIVGRRDRNWSTNTFLSYHKSLSVFFRWCVDKGYMIENYIDSIERPHLERKHPPKLKKEQATRLLEAVFNIPSYDSFLRHRNHAIFSTFIYTGIRKSELLNLKFTDVDVDNLTLFVRQGKGNKDRIIPISFTLASILRRYITERQQHRKTCPEFFVSYNRNCGLTISGLKLITDKVKQASGISFTIHQLRHTFATLMLEGGCDIYSLSRMMGHSDIKTTTIYLSATAEHLRDQVTKHPLNISPTPTRILSINSDTRYERLQSQER